MFFLYTWQKARISSRECRSLLSLVKPSSFYSLALYCLSFISSQSHLKRKKNNADDININGITVLNSLSIELYKNMPKEKKLPCEVRPNCRTVVIAAFIPILVLHHMFYNLKMYNKHTQYP